MHLTLSAHNGFELYESRAIGRYLADARIPAPELIPDRAEGPAKVRTGSKHRVYARLIRS